MVAVADVIGMVLPDITVHSSDNDDMCLPDLVVPQTPKKIPDSQNG